MLPSKSESRTTFWRRTTRPRSADICNSGWRSCLRRSQAISWKAQVRLCKRYRQLIARGKHANQVVVAIAREMAAFAWAIARTVPLTP